MGKRSCACSVLRASTTASWRPACTADAGPGGAGGPWGRRGGAWSRVLCKGGGCVGGRWQGWGGEGWRWGGGSGGGGGGGGGWRGGSRGWRRRGGEHGDVRSGRRRRHPVVAGVLGQDHRRAGASVAPARRGGR